MTYPQAVFSLSMGHKDVTQRIDDYLISLSLSESREDASDQLDISLDDADGRLTLPKVGAKLELKLGWKGAGLVDKGSFIIDEVEHEGAPDVITLRARSAELGEPLRTRKSRSFHDKTLGEIVTQIAKENGLTPKMSPSLKDKKVEHIDQTNESDVHFLRNLGKRFDAVATIKKDAVLFLPINEGKNAAGETLPTITIHRREGDKHRYHTAARDAYSGVRAQWHDSDDALEKSELAGEDDNPKRLRQVYPTQDAAQEAANAEKNRIDRGKATLSFSLALARPDIAPMMGVKFQGLKAPISGTEWLVAKVTHSLSNQGFTTELELETKTAESGEDETKSSNED